MLAHEAQQPGLPFDAVLDCTRDVAPRGVRAEHHQEIGKPIDELAEIGARPIGPEVA
jgi:hypothetical protein